LPFLMKKRALALAALRVLIPFVKEIIEERMRERKEKPVKEHFDWTKYYPVQT